MYKIQIGFFKYFPIKLNQQLVSKDLEKILYPVVRIKTGS